MRNFVLLGLSSVALLTSAARAQTPPAQPESATELPAVAPSDPAAQSTETEEASPPINPTPNDARTAPVAAPPEAAAPPPVRSSASPSPAQHVMTVPPEPPAPKKAGVREHDGLYLRLGMGFGAFHDQLFADLEDDLEEVAEVSGIGTAFELALGGTAAEGLVVGGGIFGSSVLASNLTLDEDSNFEELPPAEVDPASASMTIIGPFVDRWFAPDSGLHLQGAVGLAALSGLSYDVGRHRDGRDVALGAGLMVGIGHEWWVGEQWGVGVLGRVTGAVLFQEDDSRTDWIHVIGTMPSVLFTTTFQ